MKMLEYVKNNIDKFERDNLCDRRFTCRLMNFVDAKEWEKFGFTLREGAEPPKAKEWTEENVLRQLKDDVAFGIDKALDHRGISSELMAMVCCSWLDVLEDEDIDRDLYGWYGSELFKAIDKKYGFDLINEDTFGDYFYKEW